MKKIILISFGILTAAMILSGCEGTVTPPSNNTDTYIVKALLVRNLDDGTARMDLTLKKNGVDYKTAVIKLDTTTLDTNFSGYFRNFGTGKIAVDSSYNLTISDGTDFDTILTVSLPDTFNIIDVGYRQFIGSAEPVDWTGSVGADGYILATVPPDSAVSQDGYAEYTGVLLEGTIPPSAFQITGGWNLGVHSIYVAAYIGAPIQAPTLPFDIPALNNPPDNLTSNRLGGRICGMVLAIPDSIVVATQ